METMDLLRYGVFVFSTLLVYFGNTLYKPGSRGYSWWFFKVIGYIFLFTTLVLHQVLEITQALLIIATTALSLVISLFTVEYSYVKYASRSLIFFTDLLALTIVMTFASRYLLELVLFWLTTELIGFIAIAYDAFTGVNPEAMRASLRYLVFSMIPTDIALFIMLALTGLNAMLTEPIWSLSLNLAQPVLTTLIILGFMSKAALIPLHFWLPDAHSMAPSPVSSLLSGIMIKMGIYGILLLSNYIIDVELAYRILMSSGCLTAVYGGLQAFYQHDVKRLLAYSSISHMGAIAMLTAIYIKSHDPLAYYGVMAYTLAHAAFKTTLFMDTGVIEVIFHERRVDKLGYVYKVLPLESLAASFSILAMLGLPPTIGFFAKIWAFSAIIHEVAENSLNLLVLFVLSIEVALSMLTLRSTCRYI
jgi:NADH:ubiquinone oxidoreductase subunit 5 (chain L)/Multisubunit Na+/H+ antiporter, MnhA subunit